MPPEIVVAVNLYLLRSGCLLRAAGEWFSYSYAAVRTAIVKFLEAFILEFKSEICLPAEAEIDALQANLQRRATRKGAQWFPRTLGALDGSHIILRKPRKDTVAWIDCHQHEANVNILIYVDLNGKFRYLAIGAPRSVHDARVFAKSQLAEKLSPNAWVLGTVD